MRELAGNVVEKVAGFGAAVHEQNEPRTQPLLVGGCPLEVSSRQGVRLSAGPVAAVLNLLGG